MSSDIKKKKKESIQLSLEKLNNELVLARQEGNKRKIDAIDRCIKRLEIDLIKLKTS